jgi:hypothetical protein
MKDVVSTVAGTQADSSVPTTPSEVVPKCSTGSLPANSTGDDIEVIGAAEGAKLNLKWRPVVNSLTAGVDVEFARVHKGDDFNTLPSGSTALEVKNKSTLTVAEAVQVSRWRIWAFTC